MLEYVFVCVVFCQEYVFLSVFRSGICVSWLGILLIFMRFPVGKRCGFAFPGQEYVFSGVFRSGIWVSRRELACF